MAIYFKSNKPIDQKQRETLFNILEKHQFVRSTSTRQGADYLAKGHAHVGIGPNGVEMSYEGIDTSADEIRNIIREVYEVLPDSRLEADSSIERRWLKSSLPEK